MVKRRFWHLLCCIAALVSLAVCRSALANDIDVIRTDRLPASNRSYEVRVEVERTVDADGWDEAYFVIYGKDFNGRGGELTFNDYQNKTGIWWSDDRADQFDEWTNTFYEETVDRFPYLVAIYTDFGGGATWRSWEANVTVFVNDVNVASKHVTASSAPFSSSDEMHNIWIDESKYPYLDTLYIKGPEYVSTGMATNYVNISMRGFDQYGFDWVDPDPNESDTADMLQIEDSQGKRWQRDRRFYRTDELRWQFSHHGPTDERLTYTVTASTANSTESESVGQFEIDYRYQHKVDIVKDGEVVSTHTGLMDEELSLDIPDLREPGYAIDWKLEGGGVLVPHSDTGPKYIFGDSDGTLTVTSKPYSYVLVLDGNGATGGKMGDRVMSVGKSYLLPANCYAKTGHQFMGWSSEPDGSGDFYQNKGVVKDLATEDGTVVTLYAQWKPKTYTVTFVNKLTGERVKQDVEYEGAATPPDMPEAVKIDDSRHSVFVKWNKSFDVIKANTTVTSMHRTEAHTFEPDGEFMLCRVCGTKIDAAAYESSVFGNGSTYVVAAGCLVVLVGGVAAYAYARMRKEGGS